MSLAALPFVEFEIFDFVKICGFLLAHQIELEKIRADYVRSMERARLLRFCGDAS